MIPTQDLGKHLYHLLECEDIKEIELYLGNNVDPRYHQQLRDKLKVDTSPLTNLSITSLIGKTINQPKTAISSNDVIGNYKIIRKINEGGMGDVYLASRADGTIGKNVVVKIDNLAQPTQERRISQNAEAQCLFDLSSGNENICTVYDAGITTDGLKYIVMEYIDGLVLDEYIEKNKTSVIDILKIFITICETIGYTHQQSIIHGDIKPKNILITSNHKVKIIDFGISKKPHVDENAHAATVDYAPVEQLQGDVLQKLSDIYSIGATLYKALTGHRLFEFLDGDPYKIEKIKNGQKFEWLPIKNIELMPLKYKYFSGDIYNIIKKCVSLNPSDRYSGAYEIATDLKYFLKLNTLLEVESSPSSRTLKFFIRNVKFLTPLMFLSFGMLAVGVLFVIQKEILFTQKETLIEQKSNLLVEQKNSDSLLNQMQEFLNFSDPKNRMRNVVNVKDVLKREEERLDKNKDLDVGVKAKIQQILGDSYFGLGEYFAAEELYKKSFESHYQYLDQTSEGYIVSKTKVINSNIETGYFIDEIILKESKELLSKVLSKGIEHAYEIEVLYLFFLVIRTPSIDVHKIERDLGFDFREDTKAIKAKLWDKLTPKQKLKLIKFQIIEVYYRLGSDHFTATGSLTEVEYEKAKPLLKLIESYAMSGLEILKENNLNDASEVDFLVWMFRINYELRDFAKGDKYSNLAMAKAKKIYGDYHMEIARLYKIQFAMHSAVDLDKSIEDITAGHNVIKQLGANDFWNNINYLELLSSAYFDAGYFNKTQEIDNKIFRQITSESLMTPKEEGVGALFSALKRTFYFSAFSNKEIKEKILNDFDLMMFKAEYFWPGWLNENDNLVLPLFKSSLQPERNNDTRHKANKLLLKLTIKPYSQTKFSFFPKDKLCLFLIGIFDRLGEHQKIIETFEVYLTLPKEDFNHFPNELSDIRVGLGVYEIINKYHLYPDLVKKFKIRAGLFIKENNLQNTEYQSKLDRIK